MQTSMPCHSHDLVVLIVGQDPGDLPAPGRQVTDLALIAPGLRTGNPIGGGTFNINNPYSDTTPFNIFHSVPVKAALTFLVNMVMWLNSPCPPCLTGVVRKNRLMS